MRIRQLSCGNCLLGQTHPVFADHLLAAAHNRCIGTIIDIQMNDMGSRIIVRKINDETDIRSAKPVNGLVIIADDKKIGSSSCKKLNAFKLLPVDVLKFINKKISISLLPRRKKLRIPAKKLQTSSDHILKIQKRIFLQVGFIILQKSLEALLARNFTGGFGLCNQRGQIGKLFTLRKPPIISFEQRRKKLSGTGIVENAHPLYRGGFQNGKENGMKGTEGNFGEGICGKRIR